MQQNVPIVNTDPKTKMLNTKDMVDRGYVLQEWMNNIGVELLSLMSLLDQDQGTYGNKIPHDFILSEILSNAAMEMAIHYTIDKKHNRLMPHCLGSV